MGTKKYSVVVPSIRESIPVLKDLEKQEFSDYEVCLVKNVKPNGKARNEGVKKSVGEILIFIDDDAELGSADLLKNLVEPIEQGKADIVGSSRLIPKNANWFERMAARQIPRVENKVVHELTVSNPGLTGRHFSEVTTTCCAMRRSTYNSVGGFSETLIRGVDTEFFFRLRKKGYEFAVAPNTWVYHPYCSNIRELWKKFYWSGYGSAGEIMQNPERAFKPVLNTAFKRGWFIFYRTVLVPANIFVKESKPFITFQPLRAVASWAVARGYVDAWKKK